MFLPSQSIIHVKASIVRSSVLQFSLNQDYNRSANSIRYASKHAVTKALEDETITSKTPNFVDRIKLNWNIELKNWLQRKEGSIAHEKTKLDNELDLSELKSLNESKTITKKESERLIKMEHQIHTIGNRKALGQHAFDPITHNSEYKARSIQGLNTSYIGMHMKPISEKVETNENSQFSSYDDITLTKYNQPFINAIRRGFHKSTIIPKTEINVQGCVLSKLDKKNKNEPTFYGLKGYRFPAVNIKDKNKNIDKVNVTIQKSDKSPLVASTLESHAFNEVLDKQIEHEKEPDVEQEKEAEASKLYMARYIQYIGFGVACIIAIASYFYVVWKEWENGRWSAPVTMLKTWFKNYNCPPNDLLLPEIPVPPPGYISLHPEYTIVIEPINTLIQPVYSSTHGWRYKYSKGTKLFMNKVVGDTTSNTPPNTNIELVFWCNKPGMDTDWLNILGNGRCPVLSRDDCRYIYDFELNYDNISLYRFSKIFKEIWTNFLNAIRYISGGKPNSNTSNSNDKKPIFRLGHYEKPLENLGRKYEKLIIFDTDPNVYREYPENGLQIDTKWLTDAEYEHCIYDLTSFLTSITMMKVSDVRPIIKEYNKHGTDWLRIFVHNRNQTMNMKRKSSEQTKNRRRSRWSLF